MVSLSAIKRLHIWAKQLWFWIHKGPSYHRHFRRTLDLLQKHFPNRAVGILPNHAIGPLVQFAELYRRYCRVYHVDPKQDLVLICGTRSANRQFQKMVEREITVVQDDALYQMLMTGGFKAIENHNTLTGRAFENGEVFYPDSPLNFSFLPEEEERGQSLLRRLGIARQTPFAVIHNKDDLYWSHRGESKAWDAYRNSCFADLLPCIEMLKQAGMEVIRSGHYEDAPNPSYHSMNGLDAEDRDFMDIYIQKHAAFSINGDSGLAWVPYAFRTPVLIHNFIPMGESPCVEHGLCIPKLLKSKKDGHLLSLREIQSVKHLFGYPNWTGFVIRELSADRFQGSYYYDRHGIEVVDNTLEDLMAAHHEMLAYLAGELSLAEEDKRRQRKFKQAFPLGHPIRHQPGLISPTWLRKHEAILD